MAGFLLNRLWQSIILLVIVSIIGFVVLNMIPGGPLSQFALDASMTQEDIERLTRQLGLDRPLLLRLRMLRNKAHVFMAGSQTVPFFEYHGLPAMLKKGTKQQAGQAPLPLTPTLPPATGSAELPLDPQVAGQCSGTTPCP